jgi:hypothetical protein
MAASEFHFDPHWVAVSTAKPGYAIGFVAATLLVAVDNVVGIISKE